MSSAAADWSGKTWIISFPTAKGAAAEVEEDEARPRATLAPHADPLDRAAQAERLLSDQ